MASSTLLLLALTLISYELFELLFRYSGRRLILNPLIWSVASIIAILALLHIPYATYFAANKAIHLMLGPVTVALAVPFYEQREKVRQMFLPLTFSAIIGSLTGIISATGLMVALHQSHILVLSLAAKSVTTPIAMAITEHIGGIPALTASIVVVTGIFGAAIIPFLYRYLPGPFKVTSKAASGFGLGMAAHGVGTAKAFEENNEMGTFAGIAIGLNGLVTALFVPVIMRLWG